MRDRTGTRSVLTVLTLVLAVVGCGHTGDERPATAGPAVPVTLEPAAETLWPAGLTVSASVLPLRRAMPGTVLLGRVDEVLREEGDPVSAGQALARVESREVGARLAQAEAGVAAAEAMERNAGLTRQRMERLYERQAASRKNLDDAIAAHEGAVAQREAAEQAVEAARVNVSYSEVVSPFGGVIVEKRVEAGDTAAPGMPLFVVEDLSKVKVEAQVPETAALRLRSGDPVDVEVPAAAEGTTRRGEIDEILPTADPRSRTITIRVVLANPGRTLRSGMYARLRLPGEERRLITVPVASVVRQGPLTGLFVAGEDGLARIRWVALGEERDGRVVVLTGLEAGEVVVVDPPADLMDGMRVEAG